MNFTVKLLDPVEKAGALNKNKTGWTGVVGQLIANEADLGVSAFARTIERQNVVDFTVSLTRSDYHLYFRQPDVDVDWAMYFKVIIIFIISVH
jgi:hypothetical protein